MVFGLFLYKENKNFPFRKILVNAATSILSLALSIERASLLKHAMYDLSVSSSYYLMLIRHVVDFLYLCPPIKCDTKCALSSLKVSMKLGVNLLNHTLAGPFNVVGKAQHMILSRTPYKCMRVLNDSK